MAGAYPDPRLVAFRGDGEGGLMLSITTSKGEHELMEVTEKRAAEYLAVLAEFVARRFKDQVGAKG